MSSQNQRNRNAALGSEVLHVHHSASGEELVTALAAVLASGPADAFAPDVVSVPAKGVERWIAQRLSHHLGAA